MAYKFDSENYREKYLKLRRAVGFVLDQLDKGAPIKENITGLRTVYNEQYSDRIASAGVLLSLTKNNNAALKKMNLDQLAEIRKAWVDLAGREQLFDRFAPAVAIYGTGTEDWHRVLEKGNIRADAEYVRNEKDAAERAEAAELRALLFLPGDK